MAGYPMSHIAEKLDEINKRLQLSGVVYNLDVDWTGYYRPSWDQDQIKLSPTQIGDSIGRLFAPDGIKPPNLTETVYSRFLATDFGQNLHRLLNTGLDCDDLCEFGSEQYGMIDYKPVIVDYGLSKEIGEKYYYDYN